ncbi:MAG: hypothetical protein WCB19_06870 [Thermoplasmata archaeon]
MYYTTYRYALVGFYIVVIGLLSAILLAVSFGAGILFLILFGLIGLFGMPLHFYLVGRRLDDYDGRIPMPNAGLGLLGVDIIDDRCGRPPESEEEVPNLPSDRFD